MYREGLAPRDSVTYLAFRVARTIFLTYEFSPFESYFVERPSYVFPVGETSVGHGSVFR